MLPANDKESQTFWLWVWGGLASVLAAALATAYGLLWATLADKRYVDTRISAAEERLSQRMQEEREKDYAADRLLIEDMVAPIVERIAGIAHNQEVNRQIQDARHAENQMVAGENQKLIREVLKEIKLMRGD